MRRFAQLCHRLACRAACLLLRRCAGRSLLPAVPLWRRRRRRRQQRRGRGAGRGHARRRSAGRRHARRRSAGRGRGRWHGKGLNEDGEEANRSAVHLASLRAAHKARFHPDKLPSVSKHGCWKSAVFRGTLLSSFCTRWWRRRGVQQMLQCFDVVMPHAHSNICSGRGGWQLTTWSVASGVVHTIVRVPAIRPSRLTENIASLRACATAMNHPDNVAISAQRHVAKQRSHD